MKLDTPLPPAIYDELRGIRFEVEELRLDQDLTIAAARVTRILQRVEELLTASERAELRARNAP